MTKKTINVKITDKMSEGISRIMIEQEFESTSEFIRHCIREYFKELAKNEEGSLINDIEHWNEVQKKINKLPDEDLTSMMTGSITVERMERMAQNEIIKRLYLKTLE